MALTPEDVVNKRFQPTKFREGYDQDEVDDFLDEIVLELRRLNEENTELRKKLGGTSSTTSSGTSSADTASSDAVSSDAAVPAPVAASTKTGRVSGDPQSAKANAGKNAKSSAAATTAGATADAKPGTGTDAKTGTVTGTSNDVGTSGSATGASEASGADATAQSAAGVLAMAQRLHDEYVSKGVEQRDKIIAEAQTEATGLVDDAQEKSRKTLGELEEQKSVLEGKVEKLREFERDYRGRLKSYIEGQLRDLDARGSMAAETSGA